jgi:hypothetical protein
VGFSLPTEYKKSPQKSLFTAAVKLQWRLSECFVLFKSLLNIFLRKSERISEGIPSITFPAVVLFLTSSVRLVRYLPMTMLNPT